MGERRAKDGTHMVAPLGFFDSLFPFSASRREGCKVSSGQTEEQHACFSWLAWEIAAEFLCWHIPWALEPCKLAMARPRY